MMAEQRETLTSAACSPAPPVSIMEEEKHFLHKEQLAELRQAFIECDKNNDNFITTGELGWTMRVMGFNPTEVELQQLVNKESATHGGLGSWDV